MMRFVVAMVGAAGLLWNTVAWCQTVEELVELDKFKGYWRISGETKDGVETPKAKLIKTYLHFTDKVIAAYEDEDEKEIDIALFAVRPKLNPKGIDISFIQGPNKGRTDQAIYRLEGKKMELCIQEDPKGDRPTDFAAPAGSKRTLLILERVR